MLTEEEFPRDPKDVTVECGPKKKVPRRILHFSDGILEEYSTDEEPEQPSASPIDPKTLGWGQYTWHYASAAFLKALAVADACGEKLAWFFGITQPKYQYYIEQYQRWKEEEEEARRQEEEEAAVLAQYEARRVTTVEEGDELGEDDSAKKSCS